MKNKIIILIILCTLVFTITYVLIKNKVSDNDSFEISTPKTIYKETMSDTKGISFIVRCNNNNNIYVSVSKGILSNDNNDIENKDGKYIVGCKDKVYWSKLTTENISVNDSIDIVFEMNNEKKSFVIKYNGKNEYVLYNN